MEKQFSHLHLHTEYSMLDGACKIKDIIPECERRGMHAVAMTDHGNIYTSYVFLDMVNDHNKKIEAENALPENKDNQKEKFKLIVGCEFYMVEDRMVKTGGSKNSHLVLLAKNYQGYRNISALNTISWTEGFYGKPRLDYEILKEYSNDVICLSGCIGGDIPKLILNNDIEGATQMAQKLKDIYGEDFYLELQNHNLANEQIVNRELKNIGEKLNIKLVATNDVHYINKEDAAAQDVLLCISTAKTLEDPNRMKFPNNEFYLKDYDEMKLAMTGYEEALETTQEIVDKCEAYVLNKMDMIPGYDTPEGYNNTAEYLRDLTKKGLKEKYKEITPEIKERAEYELGIVERMGFVDYFLIVWDFIHYAESIGINVGPGRGSGAGSIVAYAISITKIDPLKYNLFFERFLNPDRVSMPDFDIDFPDDRRGEVIDYVIRKYGANRVCQIISYSTMAAKAVFKDVSRVLKIPLYLVNKIAKEMDFTDLRGKFKKGLLPIALGLSKDPKHKGFEMPQVIEYYNEYENVKRAFDLAIKLEDMPRNTAQHAAGVVICKHPLIGNMPLQANGGGTIITTQFPYAQVEKLGFLKMDFLGLQTLSDIQNTVDLVDKIHHHRIKFYEMDCDDEEVYKMIGEGDTDGVFQLESAGFKKFLRDLRPSCLEEVIAAISLYRPGPMDDIPEYIRCKSNPELIHYEVPCLKKILGPTYGVIVYQEQVMQIVQDMAGYTLGQADLVRRMMGKKMTDQMAKERQVFIHGRVDENGKVLVDGAVRRGAKEEDADKIFSKMEIFARYAFNKSHAAAYAHVTYQTAYLKCHYPVEYFTCLLSSKITKPDSLKKYIRSVKNLGIKVLPPNINHSMALFSAEDGCIRYGLCALKNIGQKVIDLITDEREANGEFKDFNDFMTRGARCGINKRMIEGLIKGGAFDVFGRPRSQLLEVYESVLARANKDSKNSDSSQISIFDTVLKNDETLNGIDYPDIPEFDDLTKLKMEKEVVGVYITGHPLEKYEKKLEEYSVNSLDFEYKEDSQEEGAVNPDAEDVQIEQDGTLEQDMHVKVGGIINSIEKHFTKNGNKEWGIVTIEDLYGTIECMVFPNMFQKYKPTLDVDKLATIGGKVSIGEGRNSTIVVDSIEYWDDTNKDKEVVKQVAEKKDKPKEKVLYLRFDTTNEVLKKQVFDILNGYKGKSDVVIKCEHLGQAFKANIKVNPSTLLKYELLTLIDEENIVIK